MKFGETIYIDEYTRSGQQVPDGTPVFVVFDGNLGNSFGPAEAFDWDFIIEYRVLEGV